MAEQVVSDAVPGIQDEGIASVADGNEDWGSAGLRMMLAQAVDSDSYVRSDSELTFTAHDATNDTVDVTAGVAYLDLTGQTIDVQSSVGGPDPPAYDTTLPVEPAIPVIVPTTVAGVALQDSTLSQVWLAYDTDGTGPGSAGSVYVRSDDTGSVSAPSHPSVELGSVNPDDSTADTLANRFGSPTFDAVSAGRATISTDERHVESTEDLQTVINDEGANSHIVVHEGTYTVDSLEISADNVTLELLKNARVKLADGASGNQVIIAYGNDFTLCGEGTVDGNAANNSDQLIGVRPDPYHATSTQSETRSEVSIRGVSIVNTFTGIFCRNYDDVQIDDVRVGGGSSQSETKLIDVTHASGNYDTVHIQNNVVGPMDATNGNDGIVVEHDGGSSEYGELCVISGNTFKAPWCTSQSDTGQYHAIFVHNGFRSVSIGLNTLRATSGDGSGNAISFRSGNGVSDDFAIVGNTLVGPGDTNHANGIFINAGSNAISGVVSGNTARNFDTTNRANLETSNVATGNGIVVVANNAEGSTDFDADTALTANNN